MTIGEGVGGGGGDVGGEICKYVKENKIDFLVMGRRGEVGVVERFLLGSSSRKCVEEAECNVVIVKYPVKKGGKVHEHAE